MQRSENRSLGNWNICCDVKCDKDMKISMSGAFFAIV